MITLITWLIVGLGRVLGMWDNPFPLIWKSGEVAPFLVVIDIVVFIILIVVTTATVAEKKGWWH